MKDFLDEAGRTPLAYIVLLAYATLAFVTDGIDPTSEQLIRYGACVGMLVQDGESWRLITHAFLHGGLLHLLFNSFFLYQIGPSFERMVGTPRFALIYVVSAVSGGIAGSLWQVPYGTLVGGSGALFGILGALVALNMRGGRNLLDFLNYAGPRQLLFIIGINLALGFLVPMISNAAHIGGLIAGFVTVFCFLDRGREAPDRLSHVIRVAWLALFASLFFYSTRPVLRFDYLLRRSLQSREPAERSRFDEALWTGYRTTPASLTGEFEQSALPPQLKARVRRWKGK